MPETDPRSQPLQTLMDVAVGAYEVATSSGAVYVIDLDGFTLSRQNPEGLPQASLRRDGESIRLIAVIECTVGRSLNLRIDVGALGAAFTWRVSTPVLTIKPLPGRAEVPHA